MIDKIQNLLKNTFGIFYVILLFFICTVVFGNLVGFSVVPLAGFFIALFGIVLLKQQKNRKSLKNEKICYKTKWIIFRIISVTIMAFLCYNLELTGKNSWDWACILERAYNLLIDGSLPYGHLIYLANYPNNRPFFLVLFAFLKFIHLFTKEITYDFFKHITMLIAFLMTQFTVDLISKIAALIWNKKKAYYVSIFTMLCLPLYLYANFLYTDVPGALLVAVMLYVYLSIEKTEKLNRKYILSVILGVLSAITITIKITAVIVLCAIIICLIIKKQNTPPKHIISIILIICVLAGSINLGINKISTACIEKHMGIDEEFRDRYEFPYTHWLMMGLGDGGYSYDDVLYTKNYDSVELKKIANKIVINSRLESMGISGFIIHLYSDKLSRTFSDSCFAGDNYAGRNPTEETLTDEIFTSNGEYHDLCLCYSWSYYALMIFGIFASGIFALIKKKQTSANEDLLVSRISLFGFTLFMLIWECNSRYLVTFIPLLILSACDGIFDFTNTVSHFINRRNKA